MSDPHTDMENWGRKLAEEQGLKLDEITYDSEMLFFILRDQPKLNVAIPKLREAALASGHIKPPYIISAFELDEDMDVEPGQVCFTMCFWNTNNK